MRHTPTTPTGTDLVIAAKPTLGKHHRVKVTATPVYVVATGNFTAAAAATCTSSTPVTPSGGVTEAHFHLVLLDACPSSDPISVTFVATDEDDTVGTAKATLIPPAYFSSVAVGDNMPIFAAADIVVQGGGLSALKIKSLGAVSAATGGAANVRFAIWQCPESADYQEFMCAREKNIVDPVPSSVAVRCGDNPSAYVLPGLGEPGSMTVESLAFDYSADVRRFNGLGVTAMIETYKEGRVLTQRSVVRDWHPVVTAGLGDGDDESTVSAEGMMNHAAHFNCNGT